MEAEELMKKRFRELAQNCYQKNQYTFTSFLGLADVSVFYEIEREFSYVPYTLWGGYGDAERLMLRFGSEEMLGYEEGFPISCLKASPVAEKFSDDLTHRDYLGALMNLGIDRGTLGDILIMDKSAWIFCTDTMADFISKNLTKVKHTIVLCMQAEAVPSFVEKDAQELKIQISSGRIDGVIAKVYKLSRSEAAEMFRQKKIFVEGRLCENSSRMLKPGEAVSVRGYGKFRYLGETGISKKGKLNAAVECYGKQ